MRIHRFYVPMIFSGKKFVIEDADLIHQWKQVFRYGVGTQLSVFSGDGVDHVCIINEIFSSRATLSLISDKESIMPQKYVALAPALIKKDNTEMVIQKAVELGVSEIFPMVTQQSEKKTLNMKRAEKIVIEATEQCGRGDRVLLKEPQELGDLLENTKDQFDLRIAFHPGRQPRDHNEIKNSLKTLVFIGPEGGFSPFEIEQFVSAGVHVYSLGDTVLRAETASIAALSLVLL